MGLIFIEFFRMKKLAFIFLSIVLVIVVACDSRTYDEASDNTPITVEVVRYQQEIKPIVDANCVVCHSPGGAASFQPLTNYEQVRNNISNILNRIQRPNGDGLKMPQGGSLSANQINLFLKWQADGLVEN
ncbi:hypothetical protein D1631_16820 [Chryseobacterium nematophagum]|uniref:Cytochrome c domain-containing protein n=2 Tax=Chryseobacterium nematophagum TaxID=2305228 RepID=A0A3M7TIS0_9FLAO|nr:hypothetical protein D1631_16820 [Chryseobacterium nematophagum]